MHFLDLVFTEIYVGLPSTNIQSISEVIDKEHMEYRCRCRKIKLVDYFLSHSFSKGNTGNKYIQHTLAKTDVLCSWF